MGKYKIKNTNIMHNGEFKEIGSIIELTDEEAKPLSDILIAIKENKTSDKNQTQKTTKPKTDDPKQPTEGENK